MNKKEISEIKKQLTPENCALTRLCACYVDGEKNKKSEMKEAFLSQSEEECFKYFEIFRKSLSGTVGKNPVSYTHLQPLWDRTFCRVHSGYIPDHWRFSLDRSSSYRPGHRHRSLYIFPYPPGNEKQRLD